TNEFTKFETEQNWVPAGHVKDFDFCYLDQPPLVDLAIRVEPEDRRCAAIIAMTQLGVNPPLLPFLWRQPDPAPDHPYILTPAAGIHILSAKRKDDGGDLMSDVQTINQKNRVWRVQL